MRSRRNLDRISQAKGTVGDYAVSCKNRMGMEKKVLRSNGGLCMAGGQGQERCRRLTGAWQASESHLIKDLEC